MSLGVTRGLQWTSIFLAPVEGAGKILEGWKRIFFLPRSGILMLIQSVLYSLMTCLFLFRIPKEVAQRMKIMRDFLRVGS